MLGEPLRFAIHDASGTLLLNRGMVVGSEQQRDRLVARGFMVAADDRAIGAARGTAAPLPPLRLADTPVFDAVRDLATRLQMLHNQLLTRTTGGFAAAITRMAAQLDDLAARDADAALASMHLDASEDGLAARLVHAGVLIRVFATALGLDARERLSIIAAALTYDVALTPVARVLNHQSSPLTPEQRRAVDAHVDETHHLLRDADVSDDIWLRAVHEHHERVDGSGYPRALAADEISLAGRMLGIVDTFSAMVRPRAYRDAVLSREALRDIFVARSRSVDERLAHAFVREIGMYPPGALVRLASREIAVVVRRGADAKHPDVRVVMQADSAPALAYPRRDTCRAEHAIVEGIPQRRYPGLQPSIHRLWRE
ncbi:hypothetical protein PAGU2595_021970 [Lysobacter xanthus]